MAQRKPGKELTGTPAQWIETAVAIDDLDSSEYGRIVSALQSRGDRPTLEMMLELSHGDLPARRLALNVLGRFGEPQWPLREEVVARLLEMWDEDAGDKAADLVAALGHHCEIPGVRERLLTMVEHPDFWVRWYLTSAFGSDGTPASTAALIKLLVDEDEVIRDWATFALGNDYKDYTPAVRAALVARLDDSDAITQLEAINGLVERGEAVVLDAILRACQPDSQSRTLWERADPADPYRVLPALEAMQDDAELSAADAEKLRAAIVACRRSIVTAP